MHRQPIDYHPMPPTEGDPIDWLERHARVRQRSHPAWIACRNAVAYGKKIARELANTQPSISTLGLKVHEFRGRLAEVTRTIEDVHDDEAAAITGLVTGICRVIARVFDYHPDRFFLWVISERTVTQESMS